MEFHDPEKDTMYTSPTPPIVAAEAQAMAGQDPSALHIINRPHSVSDGHSSDDGPTDNSSETVSPDTPDTDPELEPDPEALTRQPSGPAYSVFSNGMKKWIIAVVTMTSFLSPMTAVRCNHFPSLCILEFEIAGSDRNDIEHLLSGFESHSKRFGCFCELDQPHLDDIHDYARNRTYTVW